MNVESKFLFISRIFILIFIIINSVNFFPFNIFNTSYYFNISSVIVDTSTLLILGLAFPKYIYISFDSDVLDPSIMPATGSPVPNGLSYENAIMAVSNLIRKRHVIGLDYVEFAPIKNIQAYNFISASLIYEILGLIELN